MFFPWILTEPCTMKMYMSWSTKATEYRTPEAYVPHTHTILDDTCSLSLAWRRGEKTIEHARVMDGEAYIHTQARLGGDHTKCLRELKSKHLSALQHQAICEDLNVCRRGLSTGVRGGEVDSLKRQYWQTDHALTLDCEGRREGGFDDYVMGARLPHFGGPRTLKLFSEIPINVPPKAATSENEAFNPGVQ